MEYEWAIKVPQNEIREAVQKVCFYYQVDRLDLLGQDRTMDVAKARHVLIYIFHERLGLSKRLICDYLNRDRSTICHSLSKVNSITYPGVMEEIDEICKG